MSETSTTVVAKASTVAGLALITTKADPITLMLILVFFSVIHSVIMRHYSKRMKYKFDRDDFISSSVIAFAIGVGALIFGIYMNYPERQIYFAVAVASVVGIKIVELIIFGVQKKFGIKVEVQDLFDSEPKGK